MPTGVRKKAARYAERLDRFFNIFRGLSVVRGTRPAAFLDSREFCALARLVCEPEGERHGVRRSIR
jgi:hypothetical protein